jgi:hypothetical protein
MLESGAGGMDTWLSKWYWLGDPIILAWWAGYTDALLVLEYQAACLEAEDEDDDGSVTPCAAGASPDPLVAFSPMATMMRSKARERMQIQSSCLPGKAVVKIFDQNLGTVK